MKKNVIPVVYSSDNNYAAYLGVSIESLIENSNSIYQYEIYVLDGGISEINKRRILTLQKDNVRIAFVDVSSIIKHFPVSLFYLTLHFTIATYYRFFLPQLFPNFKKLCYIDCDTVVLKDIADLYKTDVKNYYLGVTRDIENIKSCTQSRKYKQYYYNTLKIQNHLDYFNAGCLVCNIEKMKADNLTEKLILRLKEIGNPRYPDQCILNSVCEGKVKFIAQNWNFTWHTIFDTTYKKYVPSPFLEDYEKAAKDPYIIHFTGMGLKPWINLYLQNSEYFWKYARQTPFYEEILQKMLSDNISAHINDIAVTVKNNGSNTFSALPVVNKIKYKLFNFIPLWSYRISDGKCKYKLLGLPLFSRKIKGGRTVYKFCGIPFWKIRRMANNITTKYYLFGIPLLKVSKK